MDKVFLPFVILLVPFYTGRCSAQQSGDITLPITYRSKALEESEQVCGPEILRQRLQADIDDDLTGLIRNALPALVPCDDRNLGQLEHCPAANLSHIGAQSPVLRLSGYYWVTSGEGTAVKVFCDMDRVCGCNITGGWTRIANLNISNTSQQCPGDLILRTYSSEPMRLCGRGSSGSGCVSAVYSTYGIRYSRVCGRVTGYQYGSTDAFLTSQHNIEGPYVDGVSLTHGPPGARQHIWTFAAGSRETQPFTYPSDSCPCEGGVGIIDIPSLVGNDYFCESGNPLSATRSIRYTSDPLWDGQGCGSPPCCELSYPLGVTAPWFCKQLPQATTDDLEVRICADQTASSEDIPLELIELYIH